MCSWPRGESRAAFESPPQALTASTIHGSVLFAIDTNKAAGFLSKTAILIAEGVLRAMIRAKLQSAIVMMLALVGLLVPAWLVQARQTGVDRPEARVPAAGPKIAVPAVNLEGRWILRVYPGGKAMALIGFDGPSQERHVKLLSVGDPGLYDLARSGVDHLRIDEKSIRFTLKLFMIPRKSAQSIEIIAYCPEHQAKSAVLRGCWIGDAGLVGRGTVLPVALNRTDSVGLGPKEWAAEPGYEALLRYNRAKDPANKKAILDEIMARYGDTPMAPFAAWCLVIVKSDARAPGEELRASIEQAARISAVHGREMEIGAIGVIVDNLIGAAGRGPLILEYARKAVAMLHPDDPAALQIPTLRNLAAVLRRATSLDETTARTEVEALEDRIATLARRAGGAGAPAPAQQAKTGTRSDNITWARNFSTAWKQAKAEGRLIMVDFYTQTCGWCKRLDADVFPRPEVAEAMRAFVPVKVDAEDGEGRPLVKRYQIHVSAYPAILFLDPTIPDPKDARIVGKIPGFMPAASFAEQLRAIAHLPRDVGSLTDKVHPDDGEAMRRLATALAMQSREMEAVALIDRAWGPGADSNFDRWAAVYNTLGHTTMQHLKLAEAAEWYSKAARVGKRPIDVYNARLGAGLVAAAQRKGDQAVRELEVAARVEGVSSFEREFAKELLSNLVSAGVREAAAVLERLKAESAKP
jgi:thioredoxin-related protein